MSIRNYSARYRTGAYARVLYKQRMPSSTYVFSFSTTENHPPIIADEQEYSTCESDMPGLSVSCQVVLRHHWARR